MLRSKHIALGGLLILGASLDAHGGVVTIQPSKDNTLYEDASGDTSNGAGEWVFTGKTGANEIRRAVMAFDVAGNVPTGATINSVALTVRVSISAPGSGARTHTLHRLIADWGEGASDAGPPGGDGAPAAAGDATWLHTFFSSDFWSSPGGDFVGASSGTADLDFPDVYTFASTPQMVADVQDWLAAPAANFGWIIVGDESEVRTAKRIDGKDHQAPEFRPVLTIEFTEGPAAVPAVSFWGLIVMTLVGLSIGTLAFGLRGRSRADTARAV